jgi:hypothetical protein
MRREIIGSILVLALVASSIGVVSSQKPFGMQAPAMGHQWFGGSGWMNQLTEEQKADVWDQMHELQQQICDLYNLSCPGGPLSNLTEEERAEVQEQIQEFRQAQRNDSRDFQQSQKQEAEQFWQQICDQYNITGPIGPGFMYGNGYGLHGNKGSQKQGHGPGFGGWP